LKVLFSAWKSADLFKKLVTEEMYIALNIGRPQFLSEIVPLKMVMDGEAPKLLSIALCSKEDY